MIIGTEKHPIESNNVLVTSTSVNLIGQHYTISDINSWIEINQLI